jgi:hypothetical protein
MIGGKGARTVDASFNFYEKDCQEDEHISRGSFVLIHVSL